jgi:5'-nucleotidase
MRPVPALVLRRLAAAAATTLALSLAACGTSGGEPAPPARPLSILLTNDDGWDAAGITAVYDALVARGHKVTLVGPAANQSGASMSTSPGALDVTRPDPGQPKYAVSGTPVDATMVGLTGILTSPPDLVVSGTNLGANVAYNVNYSGTVGAATAAAERGIPAIAVSADNGDGTQADFRTASELVVDLVDELAADDGKGLDRLGGDGFLNVNVPVASRGGPEGVRFTEVGEASPWRVTYRDHKDGTYAEQRSYSARVGADDDDARALSEGIVSISWLTPERSDRSPSDLEKLLPDFDPFD